MAEVLSGHGGSITMEGKSISIGDWRIYHRVNQVGMNSWRGSAESTEFGISPGDAEGVFKSGNRAYSGKIVVNHVKIPAMIFDFVVSGKLSYPTD